MVFCCGNCWCSYRDPITYLAVPFAVAQILYVVYCMSFHLVLPILGTGLVGSGVLIVFYVLTILILWSYYEAMFTEPGIVNMEILERIEKEDPQASTYRRCKRCNCIKPFRAHHCRRCQRCILKMDHHCPWISNCVGARNQKPFMLFLIYVGLAEGMAIVMTIKYCIYYKRRFQRYFHWIPMEFVFEGLVNHPKVVRFMRRWHIFFPLFESPLNTQILVSVQMIFSVIFCVFCFVLLYDQLKNVWYDRTYIEESNGQESGKRGTFYDSLVETMGEPFCLNWFLPRPGKNIDAIIRSLSIEVVQVEDSHEKKD